MYPNQQGYRRPGTMDAQVMPQMPSQAFGPSGMPAQAMPNGLPMQAMGGMNPMGGGMPWQGGAYQSPYPQPFAGQGAPTPNAAATRNPYLNGGILGRR